MKCHDVYGYKATLIALLSCLVFQDVSSFSVTRFMQNNCFRGCSSCDSRPFTKNSPLEYARRSAALLASLSTATSVGVGPRIGIKEDYDGLILVHSNPDVYVIQEFLDASACQDIITKAKAKTLGQSPVAYAGWTDDFKDLVELVAKGPVSILAIVIAWFQTKDSTTASQLSLVVHMVQNFAVLLVFAVAGIAAFTKSREASLQSMRTSTSTTLDDLTASSGATKFVQNAAELFGSVEQAALFEAPTVIRYEENQVLAPHYDANRSADTEDANRGGQTLATLIVYLNDVGVGGLTRFGKLPGTETDSTENKLTIQPKLGDALLFFPADANGMFDERLEHEGCPAVDEKWIARIWRHRNRVPPPFGLSPENLELVK